MSTKKFFYFSIITATASLLFFLSFKNLKAESYDIFVDKNYSGSDENGSSEKPFKNIKKALEVAGISDIIYLKNGIYDELVVLEGEQELHGEDKNKTIIKNWHLSETVALKGKNKLKNVTVSGGTSAVIFFGEGLLEDCFIKDAVEKGIDLVTGNGRVQINNSKITRNRKGIYVQKGRSIAILNNEFVNNYEEGIDIREEVRGTISKNYIARNGESGIEIVVGSSNIIIRNNRIERNSASGIATQFYKIANKRGHVQITKNTINHNNKYGIRCSSPQGDKIPKSYWNDSLSVTENKIENNVGKAIDNNCNLIMAITSEEEKKNKTIKNPTVLDFNSNIAKEKEEERQRQEELLRQKRELFQQQIEREKQKISKQETVAAGMMEVIRNQNKIKVFLMGSNKNQLAALKQELENLRNALKEIEKLREEADEETKSGLSFSFVDDLNSRLREKENFINKEENRFSFFGWFFKLISRK